MNKPYTQAVLPGFDEALTDAEKKKADKIRYILEQKEKFRRQDKHQLNFLQTLFTKKRQNG